MFVVVCYCIKSFRPFFSADSFHLCSAFKFPLLFIIEISVLFLVQESIRNSADSVLLSAPDSLIVSLTKNQCSISTEQLNSATIPTTPHGTHAKIFGIDGLDLLKFTYKVCMF